MLLQNYNICSYFSFGQRKWRYSTEDTFGYTHLYVLMYVHVFVFVCGGRGEGGKWENNSPTIQPHMKSIRIEKASTVTTLDYESVIQRSQPRGFNRKKPLPTETVSLTRLFSTTHEMFYTGTTLLDRRLHLTLYSVDTSLLCVITHLFLTTFSNAHDTTLHDGQNHFHL